MAQRHPKRTKEYLEQLCFEVVKLRSELGLGARDVVRRLRDEGWDIRSYEHNRLVKWAYDHNLVEVHVDRIWGGARITGDLSETLEVLLNIPDVLIVDASSLNLSWEQEIQGAAVKDELLHEMLGTVAAHHFLGHLLDGDKVALSGGRAVRFTIENLHQPLARRQNLSFRNVQITSLCGIARNKAGLKRGMIVDVNSNATRLAQILQIPDDRIEFTDLDIALQDPNGGEESWRDDVIAAEAPHILGETWEVRPDICLFGLGNVDGRDGAEDRSNQVFSGLSNRVDGTQAIQEEMAELRKLFAVDTEASVAEICGQFFWSGTKSPPDHVRELLERLNIKIVSVSIPRMNQAREKILVAGGDLKYAGIWALFARPEIGLKVTSLVTDLVTAKRLLQDFHKPSKRVA